MNHWATFLAVRRDLIEHWRRAGTSCTEIARTLSMDPGQVYLISRIEHGPAPDDARKAIVEHRDRARTGRRTDASEAWPELGVLKHGIGYDLVVNRETGRLELGIRCQTCQRTSYHPKDVEERFCGQCKVFHEDRERGPV